MFLEEVCILMQIPPNLSSLKERSITLRSNLDVVDKCGFEAISTDPLASVNHTVLQVHKPLLVFCGLYYYLFISWNTEILTDIPPSSFII